MVGRHTLGEFERHVLLVIHHLRGQGYAVSIAAEIGRRASRAVSLGAVYATMDRLEKKGLVSSHLGEPTPERGGKPKRFYDIKGEGIRALAEVQRIDARMWAAVPPIGAPL